MRLTSLHALMLVALVLLVACSAPSTPTAVQVTARAFNPWRQPPPCAAGGIEGGLPTLTTAANYAILSAVASEQRNRETWP